MRAADAAREARSPCRRGKWRARCDALEADLPANHLDIGAIAVACALGYLDLRYANEPWRDGHPKLAAWYEDISKHPCMATTRPA